MKEKSGYEKEVEKEEDNEKTTMLLGQKSHDPMENIQVVCKVTRMSCHSLCRHRS